MVKNFNLGDKVQFKYAGMDKTGVVIGKTSIKTQYLIRFEYNPNQIKREWLHKNVLKLDINGEM